MEIFSDQQNDGLKKYYPTLMLFTVPDTLPEREQAKTASLCLTASEIRSPEVAPLGHCRGQSRPLGEPIALTVRQCILGYHLTQDIAYPSGSPQRPIRKRCGRPPSPKPISLAVRQGKQRSSCFPAEKCLGVLRMSRVAPYPHSLRSFRYRLTPLT